MQRSTERFLTTHTGSLPRPDDLDPHDVRQGGRRAGRRRARCRAHRAPRWPRSCRSRSTAGVDIVNDGEMSKPSYATYIKDRLDGFGGDEPTAASTRTSSTFPRLRQARVRRSRPRAAQDAGLQRADHACATRARPQTDVENLKAALGGDGAGDGVPDRGVAGRDLAVLPQRALPERRGVSLRDRRRDAARIRDDRRGRHRRCRSIAPTSAWAATSSTPTSSLAEFRKKARLHVEALNHALADIPPERMRMHLCWGNYEGPHHCDVPLADIIDIVFLARPAGDLVRGRQSAPRARMGAVRDA